MVGLEVRQHVFYKLCIRSQLLHTFSKIIVIGIPYSSSLLANQRKTSCTDGTSPLNPPIDSLWLVYLRLNMIMTMNTQLKRWTRKQASGL